MDSENKQLATSAPEAEARYRPGLQSLAGGGWRRFLGPVVTALVLTLVLITLPRLPLGTDDDSSWSAVMDYAHQKGMQFGTDIAFSYGPLGFLITPYYSPSHPWLRMAADATLSFLSMAGLAFLVWRLGRLWRALCLGIFVLLAANADPRNELLLALGLLCWGLLCLVESGPRLTFSLAVLAGLAVFGILAKMTLLVPAALGLGAVGGCLALQRRAAMPGRLWIGTALLLALAWVGLGQKLLNLGPFILNGLRISAGYDQAMWADPFPVLKWPGLLMLLLTVGVVLLRVLRQAEPAPMPSEPLTNLPGQRGKWQRGLLVFWLISVLFIIWKHGFVRAGRDHLEVFFGFVPIMALILEVLPGARPLAQRWARGLALACCVIAILAVQWLFAGNLRSCLARPFRLAALHVANLTKPFTYQRQLGQLQQAEVDAGQLPRVRSKVGRGSVDVFGCNQAYAIFNGLNFQPRPVFQSYAAYSAALMNLNEQFYLAQQAPEYVLFRLNAIDDRFPPLEDARVFRDLLINYQPLEAEGPFLLLRSRQAVKPTLTLLREGTLGPTDVIGLKEYGSADLWLEINLKPNLLGQLSRFFYRPSEVTLAVWCDTPTKRVARFRAPAPMLAAGFLASPLPLDNGDVRDLYAGKPITRPSAYSIELSDAAQCLWSDAIQFRLYKIQNQVGHCATTDLAGTSDFPGFETPPLQLVATKHMMLSVEGKPALLLPPGGFMKFAVPGNAKLVQGKYGFSPAAYLLRAATAGAEFRIESEHADGSVHLLYSQTLRPRTNPEDRGMKSFSIPLAGTGTRKVTLKSVSLAQTNSILDLTCWANVAFR